MALIRPPEKYRQIQLNNLNYLYDSTFRILRNKRTVDFKEDCVALYQDTYTSVANRSLNRTIKNMSSIFSKVLVQNDQNPYTQFSKHYLLNGIYAAHLDARGYETKEDQQKPIKILHQVITANPTISYDPLIAQGIMNEIKNDAHKPKDHGPRAQTYTTDLGSILNTYASQGFLPPEELRRIYEGNDKAYVKKSNMAKDLETKLNAQPINGSHGFLNNKSDIVTHFEQLRAIVKDYKLTK